MQKIIPNLWFDDNAEEAVHFYTSLLPNSSIDRVDRYGPSGAKVTGRPEGSVLGIDFTLNGQQFTALNGGPVFQFTPAISLYINCATQEEADILWYKLLEGGTPMECGWLTDKYGLSWQVVPEEMTALVHDPDPVKAEKATAAMLKQVRLDVAEVKKAMEAT